jgi:hypothetical protein
MEKFRFPEGHVFGMDGLLDRYPRGERVDGAYP